ncbi:ABC transporter substrate-binding protein [Clostridium sp.]|uniref:ABC transporter substrate-binding protein n=1 Tax=Clostridium sp. TaxID=1506 RepID=UPI0028403B58|nr:ABC transporter substrate-binding protein [Clostridium sp.]MDR3596204.1 ABC transporter substrate-binding protein [Clostridium sp.]
MKKIQKKFLILIVIVNFIGIIIQGVTCSSKITTANDVLEKDRLQTIKEKGVLTIASANEIPFSHIDPKTNKISGVDVDIITEIAKRLGINKVEMKEVPFANLIDRLITDDSIDLAANGIYITPERKEIISFTEPLYRESEAVIVPKASKINFKSDLKNAVVGAEKGTKFADLAKSWKKNNLVKDVVLFKNIPEMLIAINNGKIDAGVGDSAAVDYFLLEDKSLFLRTLEDYTPELAGITGIAVKKNDTALLNALNEKINEMKADGTLYAILVKYGLNKSNIV